MTFCEDIEPLGHPTAAEAQAHRDAKARLEEALLAFAAAEDEREAAHQAARALVVPHIRQRLARSRSTNFRLDRREQTAKTFCGAEPTAEDTDWRGGKCWATGNAPANGCHACVMAYLDPNHEGHRQA